ncbi:uncharacterized protein EAF01_001450 [Botrytis porri]|uniref:uncharacterized protein n=1 Tax=Botrytis porri TaxID=87229 RepID=UPI001900B032|nr:uncharacterized protein EAF01_001450 [Botrytis porri]KAF7912429.1 hypothetical protein EAF01_001450 [Botrytis porri]
MSHIHEIVKNFLAQPFLKRKYYAHFAGCHVVHVLMVFGSHSVSKDREAYDRETGESDHSSWVLTEAKPLRSALELLTQGLCAWPYYLMTSLWGSEGYQNRADGRSVGKYKEWSCGLPGEYVAKCEMVPVSSAVRGSCGVWRGSLALAKWNLLGFLFW